MRGNTRLAYDPGISPDPTAATIVMLHAVLGDRSTFTTLREALSDRYRVLLPDARGHGASATLANQWYTVGELAEDVLAILDAEGVTRAHLAGHELGGATALEIARRAPDRVLSLVLIEPAINAVLDIDSDSRIVATRNDTRAADREAGDAAYKNLIDKALDGYLNPRWGPAWREEITKPRFGAVRRHAGALAGILPALDAFKIDRAELNAITVPTLVVMGEDIVPVARHASERLAGLLPNARLDRIRLESRANDPFGGETAIVLGDLIGSFAASP
jgi:3-oxoadipate enol-lactonase